METGPAMGAIQKRALSQRVHVSRPWNDPSKLIRGCVRLWVLYKNVPLANVYTSAAHGTTPRSSYVDGNAHGSYTKSTL